MLGDLLGIVTVLDIQGVVYLLPDALVLALLSGARPAHGDRRVGPPATDEAAASD